MCCNWVLCAVCLGFWDIRACFVRSLVGISTPILEGIYVLQHVKGVVKMVILCVNDGNFLPALDTFGKKRRPRRRGLYSPQRPVAFAFGELLPQPLCGRLFEILADLIGYLNCPIAAPKRLREQLASGTSESDELRSRQAASVWSAVFPAGT